LRSRISELGALDARRPDYSSKANIALDTAKSTVRDVFGQESDESRTFRASLLVIEAADTFDDAEMVAHRQREETQERVVEATARLENLLKIVDEKASSGAPAGPRTSAPSRRVFVIHGHDHAAREVVARFLLQVGLEPVILQEQPGQGRTIIEKLEASTDVGYAVVLMTGDDRGGPKNADPTAYHPRARQNVIFELGHFSARLGRGKVCVLYEPGVEKPSDYDGVSYIRFESGEAWKLPLAKELKAADLPVDVNRLLH
jgi:predicted nucleotide-binding protein